MLYDTQAAAYDNVLPIVYVCVLFINPRRVGGGLQYLVCLSVCMCVLQQN